MIPGMIPANLQNALLSLRFVNAGVDDPSVVATDGVRGCLYVRYGTVDNTVVGLFQKLDDGLSTNWTPFAAGGAGANTFLSNLTSPTALNQSLEFNIVAPAIQTKDQTGAGGTETIIVRTGNITTGSGTTATGAATFRSGNIDATATTTTAGTGDSVFRSGDILQVTNTGTTGAATFRSGDSSSSSTGTSGAVVVRSGNVTGSVTSGTFLARSGNATGGAGTGTATIQSGNANTGTSGIATLKSGTGLNTGAVFVVSSNVTIGNSGTVNLSSGSSTSGNTGAVSITSGGSTAGGASGPAGLFSGSGNQASPGATGFVFVASGAQSGTGTSGEAHIASGANSGAGDSGVAQMFSGQTVGGTSGLVLVRSGDSSAGASGDVRISTGTAGTTRGILSLDGLYIDATSKNISNVLDPVLAQDAATKAYVDAGGLTATLVNFAMSPYTVLQSDKTLIVDTSGGNVVLNLPTVVGFMRDRMFTKSTVDANTVTVNPAGGETIAYLANKVLVAQGDGFLGRADGINNTIVA